jgi:penicillin-binding protein 1C
VPYGNRIHGIGYAARRYLDKPVDDLSWAEIAFLSALPQAPARMNPFDPAGRRRAIARGARLLRVLRKRGVLDAADYAVARSQIAVIRVPSPARRPPEALHALLRLAARFRSADERRPYAARPIVETTIDLELQREAARAASDVLRRRPELSGANASAIVLDRASGEVRAWLGSSDYFDASRAGAIDFTGIPRSAGSTLKPFLYALALERGVITPATILDDLSRGAGGIANADDAFLGPLLPRVALANSRNVPAANLLARVGLDEGYGFFRDLGLHDGRAPARRYGLGLAIGGLPVTLDRLAAAYTVLAGGGERREPRWDSRQKIAPPRRLLSEESAREITLFLSDPLARLPSFPRMGTSEYPFPVAVKTGTSTNYRDAWTVAYSPRAIVAVWVGDPDFRPMNRITGYASAAEVARRLLTFIHGDQMGGLDDVSFPPPRGYRPVRVCALTGRRATDRCDRVFLEWFAAGTEPVEPCAAHVSVAVDRRTGRPATAATPPARVQARLYAALDRRYARWAEDAGIPALASQADAAPTPIGVPPRVRITSPEDGALLIRDPETPAPMATLELAATISPAARQIVWSVDGRPFTVSDYPAPARWPLRPGPHVIEARVPFTRVAARVRVDVR